MISEADRQINEAWRLADGAALVLGREVYGRLTVMVPCGACRCPMEEGLERQEQDAKGYPEACKVCGLLPLTKRERKRLLAASEEYRRRLDAQQANLVHTVTAQYAASSWECQHGRRWYVDAAAGRPVMSPARTIAEGSGWLALDCGLGGRECGKEHARRMDAEVDEVDVRGGYAQTWSGWSAGPRGGVIAMPFSSAYPMGTPTEVLPT